MPIDLGLKLHTETVSAGNLCKGSPNLSNESGWIWNSILGVSYVSLDLVNIPNWLGAFAVGMALSASKVFEKIENFISRIGLIFAPLFFAIIGAQVDFRTVNLDVLMLSAVVIAIAIATKLLGCGLPSILFLKNKAAGMRVGIGMISRGEVGLIVAGVGLSSGVLTGDVYTTIVLMVAVTTIITPIWLKMDYRKEVAKVE